MHLKWAPTIQDEMSDTLVPYEEEIRKLQEKKTVFDQFEKANMLTTLVESDSDSIMKKLLGERKVSTEEINAGYQAVFSIKKLMKKIRSSPFAELQKRIEEGFDLDQID
jgi:hypothetical protein